MTQPSSKCQRCSAILFVSCNNFRRFRIQIMFFHNRFEQCFNSCSNNCFLFEKCAREGGCQGAPGHWNRVLFESVWATFFKHFFGAPFFTQIWHFERKSSPRWSPNEVLLDLIFKKYENAKSVFGLRRCVRIACEPISKSTWCDKKSTNKNRCVSSTLMSEQWPPKCVQMGEFILVVAPLGAPVAPLFETCTQKCSKSGPKIAKMHPKGIPKW